jgi:hypothetical protein
MKFQKFAFKYPKEAYEKKAKIHSASPSKQRDLRAQARDPVRETCDSCAQAQAL